MKSNIDKIIKEKEERKIDLEKKLAFLDPGNYVLASYDMLLSLDEQRKYAKIGIFHLWYDIKNYKKKYGDNSRTEK